MLPVRLEAALLRGQIPDLLLRPGATLAARVVAEGRISLAGVVLEASLPEGLAPGQTLRLRIEDATPERLHLRMVDQPGQAPPPVALPLPGGAQAKVRVEEREAAGSPGGGHPAVGISYESPALGRIELRLELPAGAVLASVRAARGEPAKRAQAAGARLREGLARATGRPATVRVSERRDPFETYA